MHISLFESIREIYPDRKNIDWNALMAMLIVRRTASTKSISPCFSPVLYKRRTQRGSKNVETVSLAVLDFDALTELQLETLLDGVLDGHRIALYTTASHPKPGNLWACRILLDISRPITPEEWPQFWARLDQLTGYLADASCKDLARMYFLPCKFPEKPDPLVIHEDGEPIDVDLFLSLPAAEPREDFPAIAATLQVAERLNIDEVRRLALTLRRGRITDPQKPMIGRNLLDIIAGRPYGAPGKRHSTMLAVTMALALAFPGVDPEEIGGLFAPSHAAMDKTDPDAAESIEYVKKAFAGAVAKLGISKPTPADTIAPPSDTLMMIAAKHGLSSADEIPWVLHTVRGELYPLGLDGSYRQSIGMRDVPLLETFQNHPYVAITDDKGRELSLKRMLRKYGRMVQWVNISLGETYGRFDAKNETLWLPVQRAPDLQPTEDPQIHAWLTALGGAHPEKLLDWIALCPQQEKTTCALYLKGIAGTGKTMLAQGLSKIWRHGAPVPMHEAMSPFNAALAHSPLIFADESLPDFPPKMLSQMLRTMIDHAPIRICAKFAEPVHLHGGRRIILASNDTDLLDFEAELGNDDLDALSVRILQLNPSEHARDLLMGLSNDTKSHWIAQGIAEHALYLANTRAIVVPVENRFAVQGLPRLANVGTGHFQTFALRAVAATIEHAKSSQILIRWGNGEVHVNQEGLLQAWHAHNVGVRAPSNMARILSSLSKSKHSVIIQHGATRRRYWPLDLDIFYKYLDANGYVADDFRPCIEKPLLAEVFNLSARTREKA